MIVLPLQWEKHAGPDATGQHKLIFTMDESVNHGEFNPMTLKKGTQFLVMMVEAGTQEQTEFASETAEETKNRFFKQMHVLIADIAKLKGKPHTEVTFKDELRSKLIQEGVIQKSTSELTIHQLAAVIIRLKKYKHEQEKTASR